MKQEEVKIRINFLEQEERMEQQMNKECQELQIGDKIKVLFGPYEAWEGKVLKIDKKNHKVKVLINIFGYFGKGGKGLERTLHILEIKKI